MTTRPRRHRSRNRRRAIAAIAFAVTGILVSGGLFVGCGSDSSSSGASTTVSSVVGTASSVGSTSTTGGAGSSPSPTTAVGSPTSVGSPTTGAPTVTTVPGSGTSTTPGGGTVPGGLEQPGKLIGLDAEAERTRACDDDGYVASYPGGDGRDGGTAGVLVTWSATGADNVHLRFDGWEEAEVTVATSGSLQFDAVPCERSTPIVVRVLSYRGDELRKYTSVSITSH